MIRVESVSRLYGDFRAVDNVSFTIGKGEIVGLLGHNGAGKTTIMKLLTAFLEPDAGKILINGKNIADQPEAVQSLIGYLPENLPLYDEMSVIDYLDYVADLRGLNGDSKTQAIRFAIEQTELSEKAFQPIATLSRGFKQRVGVAQAILHRPSVLILDEPTNGLDPTQTMQMRRLISRCAENATIILSTHIMQEVDAICDRVLILSNGKLALDDKLKSVQTSPVITLETNIDEAELSQLLSEFAEITTIHCDEFEKETYLYSLHLDGQPYVNTLISNIARKIITSGGSIYEIAQQKHDLESVFRQVSAAGVEPDAA